MPQVKQAIELWARSVQGPYQRGRAALYTQQYEEARTSLRASVAQQEGDLVDKYLALGAAEYGAGRYPEAIETLEKAYRLRPKSATVLNELAITLQAAGRYPEAEFLLQRALAIHENAWGREHPKVATSSNNLGIVYESQGRYGQAEPLFRRALAIDEKVLGPEHSEVITVIENLASVLSRLGREDEATRLKDRVKLFRDRRRQ